MWRRLKRQQLRGVRLYCIIKKRGNKMKYEVFYQLGNQKGIGYFSDSEIEFLKKNTSIEIINVKRGN